MEKSKSLPRRPCALRSALAAKYFLLSKQEQTAAPKSAAFGVPTAFHRGTAAKTLRHSLKSPPLTTKGHRITGGLSFSG
ncbi:hypothetical protein ABIB56_002554 [Glaciihabitans sp. UYNi722]